MIIQQSLPPFPRINPEDRVMIGDVAFRCVQNEPCYLLARVDDPRITQAIERPAFAELSRSNRYRLDRNFFSVGATKARTLVGDISLTHLDEGDQKSVLRKFFICRRFEQMVTAGQASRSDVKMKAAIAAIFKIHLEEQLSLAKISGSQLDLQKPPTHWALLDWLTKLDACGWEPICLLDNRRNRSGNRTPRIHQEVLKLLVVYRAKYLNLRQPTYESVHQEMLIELRALNVARSKTNLQPLDEPSIKKFSDFVKELDEFEIYSGRFGPEAAKKKYYATSAGQFITAIGQVIEMDEWEVQLHILLIEAGLWDNLTPEQRKGIETGRWFLCVALDSATRVILGMHLSRTACAENALRTLGMIVQDKSHFARSAGAQSSWHHCTGLGFVRTDNGSSFIASVFRIAVTLLSGAPDLTPAAIPQLRGRIERIFSTLNKNLTSKFDGRTFPNVVQGSHYSSQEFASLTIDELAHVLVRWVVDCYHNRPHEGLQGYTPSEIWSRLATQGTAVPLPDRHTVRIALSRKVERRITAYGVDFMRFHYDHPELQDYRREHGDGCTVTVAVDLFDIGYLSIRLNDKWLDVPCANQEAHGLSVDEWISAKRSMDRALAAGRKDTQRVMDETFASIYALRERAAKSRHIASTEMTDDDFSRVIREMDLGSRLPEAPKSIETSAVEQDFLAGGFVVPTPPPSKGLEAAAPLVAARPKRRKPIASIPAEVDPPTAQRPSRLEKKK